jgi:hypothetical protein
MRSDCAQHPFGLLTSLRAGYRRLASLDERRKIVFLRIAVLAISVLLMLPGVWGHSVTVVEFAHLPAGLAAWQRQSLGIYRVCGPLSKFLYALPAHLAGVRVDYPESFDSDTQSRQEWELGRLFQSQNTERYHNIYRWSRLVPIVVTILGGCLVCEWSTRLFGAWPGLLSLCVWCWMPPILAHGSLVTSDMLSAVTLLLATRSFWSFLLRPRPLTALLGGLSLGLAGATKFTLLILYPCWALLIIGRAIQLHGTAMAEVREQRTSRSRLVVLALALLVISVVVLDALYLFEDVGFRLAQWRDGLSSITHDAHQLGESRATAWLLQVPLPIPLEFFRGLDVQVADGERLQSAYLFGQTRLGGWWHWYAVASLIKVPLPVLVLFGVAMIRWPAARRGGDLHVWASLCLLAPALEAALLISATTGTGTNAAFRYLVPSLALCCVWAGQAGNSGSRAVSFASMALLGWLAVNAVVAAPDHLGWQNELAWGWQRSTGRPALIGDSLDWGQDLARLGAWISRRSGEGNIIVCACGFGDTEPYGLKPPLARPVSDPDAHSVYLAVSQAILLGDPMNYVRVGGKSSSLTEAQRETLLQIPPFDRVGRTIQVYRLRDLSR